MLFDIHCLAVSSVINSVGSLAFNWVNSKILQLYNVFLLYFQSSGGKQPQDLCLYSSLTLQNLHI